MGMEVPRTDQFLLWITQMFCGSRIDREARQACFELAQEPIRRSRERALEACGELAREPGPHVEIGQTLWEEPLPVEVPLAHLVKAHAVITGGTGSGKTMAALAIIDAILSSAARRFSFGVLDAKGELFERTLYLIGRKLETLPPPEAERLLRRLVIIDLASRDPVASYNIAAAWAGSDLDFFATSRMDTLQELLPSGEGLSLRGAAIAKHVLTLLAERGLPFSYFDRVLSSEPFRARLLDGSKNEGLRYWFRQHFREEGRATVAAVRARLASALLSSESLKLALSGNDAPDFRRLQDGGRIVLINCAGANIPRATARTLQALFLSDIRQAVFTRQNRRPFLWVCDEAQNFFRTRHLRDNMSELLTMSRSFGSFFLYLTQNLGTAVQEGDMLETLHTNIRWSLTLRTTPRDGAFLRSALPVTGLREKPRLSRRDALEFYRPSEERNLLVEELAYLPDRTGWLWLKSRSPEAIQIQTRTMPIPEGRVFEEVVGRIRANAAVGDRMPREQFLAAVACRDAAWQDPEAASPVEALTESFRESLGSQAPAACQTQG